MQRHPKGSRARVLLSSVFKPFAQDDNYGSRAINPAELYHNQVTREQGWRHGFRLAWSLLQTRRHCWPRAMPGSMRTRVTCDSRQ